MSDTPFSECKYDICDLPGQCVAEGKCHHPLQKKVINRIADLERQLAEARKENNYLRGLIQCNPEWKCTYGHDIKRMSECPHGFPGCSCGDDLLLGQDEGFKEACDRMKRAERQLAECQQDAHRYRWLREPGPDQVKIMIDRDKKVRWRDDMDKAIDDAIALQPEPSPEQQPVAPQQGHPDQ